MDDFGTILRAIRKERHLTLDKMAEMLGTTKQALSRYERGERTPKITAAARFAEVLGVPLEALLGYEPHETDPAEFYIKEMKDHHPEELAEIAELYISMTTSQRKTAMRILRSIAGEDEE